MASATILHSVTTVTATFTATVTVATPCVANQVYFENPWAILSSTGLLLFVCGVMVILIIGLTALSVVPVVVSLGAAIGHGLCFVSFYSYDTWHVKLVSGIFADIAWGINEIGLPFYSYFILRRVLANKERTFFIIVFWILTLASISQRLSILIYRTYSNRYPERNYVSQVNAHHMGEFACIGATEVFSAFFLLRKFRRSRRRTSSAGLASCNESLIRQLARSTEIRVAAVAFIGVGRSITYSFMVNNQVAQNVPSQIDRFIVAASVCFPVVLYIDLLGSKVVALANTLSTRGGHSGNMLDSGPRSSRFGMGIVDKIQMPDGAVIGRSNSGSRGGTLDTIVNDFPEYAGPQISPNKAFPSITEKSAC